MIAALTGFAMCNWVRQSGNDGSLEAQQLVERHADPADRRVVRVRLSDKGKTYIDRINEARLHLFVGLAEHLGRKKACSSPRR
ncbi:hypothetical protein GCM10020370_03860 [Paenibacillus hodogayensis]